MTAKWRMTLDELCFQADCHYDDLERWRSAGAFGDRWKESRNSGAWRHITKEVAHRAILMRKLLDLGVREERAVKMVRHHRVEDRDQVWDVSSVDGARIIIDRSTLNLP